VQGDIRLTPFYNINECLKKVEGYVAELNKGEFCNSKFTFVSKHNTDINVLVTGNRGPCSKYHINIAEGEFKGELEIVWSEEPLSVLITIL